VCWATTHADTLIVMSSLGNLYTVPRQVRAGRAASGECYRYRSSKAGEDNATTLQILNNLALTYKNEGKYAQAEPLYTNALETRRRVLGEEHDDTLVSMNNLSMLYRLQGKYAQAEPLQTKVVSVWRRTLGEEHPLTIAAVNNLGLMHYALGQYSQGEELWAKLLEVIRRVLGNEHPNTLTTMANLASAYRLQRKYAQAEPLLESALVIGRRVQGEQHPNTLLTMKKLADLYKDEGKFAEAEMLYSSVVDGRQRTLGNAHPDTLIARALLGRVVLLQQKHAAAETTLRAALADYEKNAPTPGIGTAARVSSAKASRAKRSSSRLSLSSFPGTTAWCSGRPRSLYRIAWTCPRPAPASSACIGPGASSIRQLTGSGSLSNLQHNLVVFGRLLRRAGIDVHVGRLIDVTDALQHVDLSSRDEVYHTCRALLVHRHDQLAIFDRAFACSGARMWVPVRRSRVRETWGRSRSRSGSGRVGPARRDRFSGPERVVAESDADVERRRRAGRQGLRRVHSG
jgi:tetratricopeptide (TPR) repeat protein